MLGDSLERLRELDANSVDSVVTDPPYGLSFMNKHWDYDVPSVDLWREVFRVLKPGGHLLSFGGTRTYHRMVVAIEDAGFEIRDTVCWHYASGFPKSLNVEKAIIKMGVDAEKYAGLGTAIKPATELIALCRKPLSEKTVAANVLKWGCGAINVDQSRIGSEQTTTVRNGNSGAHGRYGKDDRVFERLNPPGRWPANVLLSCCGNDPHDADCAAAMLDAQSGHSISRPHKNKTIGKSGSFNASENEAFSPHNDSGGASRFFYVAKASKRERNAGMGDAVNHHPTVKPVKLMEYLVRMITPPGGVCLDPFMGSGSTGVACVNLGFNFIGIERDEQYLEIAKRRIAHAELNTIER